MSPTRFPLRAGVVAALAVVLGTGTPSVAFADAPAAVAASPVSSRFADTPCHGRFDGAQVAEHGVLWECRFDINDRLWAWEIIGPTNL